MKRMSFSKTKQQILDGTKTVTRRLGWSTLKPGERFLAVEKCMGLKKGEKQVVLRELECVSNRCEPLNDIRWHLRDCEREGFNCDWKWFVRMFVELNKKCTAETPVQRIEFRYVEPVNIEGELAEKEGLK